MRWAPRIALVCTVVVLAGCQFGGGDAATTTTRDPFGVPDTTAPPTAGTDVPGLTEAGVTDPGALADAHVASLEGRSYTLRRTLTHSFANGTLRTRRTVHAEFGSDRESYRYRTAVEGTVPAFLTTPRGRLETWSNGSASYQALTEANATRYFPDPGGRDFVRQYDRFLVLFGAVQTNLTGRTTENGTTLYRVESTGATRPEDVPVIYDFRRGGRTVDSVTNVSLVAWIDDTGTVHRYRLTYAATRDGTPIEVVETHRVTGVGTTTVERPEWVAEAINETGVAPPA